jgi:hypothetical protein
MSYKVKTTPYFDSVAISITKKHKAIKSDISKLIDNLEINPTMGSDLGQGIYKIRLAISGTNKGKSGGARIITCVVVVIETVYLAEIYLKSEQHTIDTDRIIRRLKENGLI